MVGAELESSFDTVKGLLDADLQPLAAHIEAGYSIDGDIAKLILMAIRGTGPAQLKALRSTPDRRKQSERLAERDRNLRIGFWIEKRLRENPQLKRKHAEEDAARHFGVGTTLASKALRAFRQQLDREEFPRAMWELRREFPDFDFEKPRPKRRVRSKALLT